jgi:hypothetical protein
MTLLLEEGLPAPPFEEPTLLEGPLLPPRMGALLLFVVGAGAIVMYVDLV